MGRPKKSIPQLCVDRTGRAFTKVGGKFITLGRGDSPESKLRYAQLLSNLAQGRDIASVRNPAKKLYSVTVSEVCLRFITDYALPRYKNADGSQSAEVDCFKAAIKVMRKLFGDTPASDFQALRLRVVRQSMVDGDPNDTDHKGKKSPRMPWSRKWINRQVGRIRMIFRVAASWEMVSPDVLASLETVPPLAVGETSAPEREPRAAVTDDVLRTVRGILNELHRDIFDLLLLSGARPGELLSLTTRMIDRTGDDWKSDLKQHKTAKRGKSRVLYFNAVAQLILSKYLQVKNLDQKIFPIKRNSYGQAIKRACIKAEVKPFVPHQLRHTVATKLVDELGIEAAQQTLGHSGAAQTHHYATKAQKQASDAVKKLKIV